MMKLAVSNGKYKSKYQIPTISRNHNTNYFTFTLPVYFRTINGYGLAKFINVYS